MRKVLLFIVCLSLLVAITTDVSAQNARSVYQEFKHSRGPFTSSKSWNHTINMPANLRSQGYSFYTRQIQVDADTTISNERLQPHQFSFTFRLNKSFMSSKSGSAKVTLWARRNNNTGTVPTPQNPNNNPYNPGYNPGYNPNQGYGYNMPPTQIAPAHGTVFNKNNMSYIRFQWQGNGDKYQLKVNNNHGKEVLNKRIDSNHYDWKVEHNTLFGNIFLSTVETGQLRWQVRQKVNGDWSQYTGPWAFTVYNHNYNGGYPNTGYPNTGYPNTGYPTTGYPGGPLTMTYPMNGGTVSQTGATFSWNGGTPPYTIRVVSSNGATVLSQQVNSNFYTYNGGNLRVGQRYMWMLKDRSTTYSAPVNFTVQAGYTQPGYPNNGYPNQPGYAPGTYPGGYTNQPGYAPQTGPYYTMGQQVTQQLDYNQTLTSVSVQARVASMQATNQAASIAVYVDNQLIGRKNVTGGLMTFGGGNRKGRQLIVKITRGGCHIDGVWPIYAGQNVYTPGQPGYGNTYPGTTYPGTTYPGTTYPGTTYPGTTYPNQPGYAPGQTTTTPGTANTVAPPTPVGPSNGATMDLRPIMLQWQGTGQVYQVMVNSPQGGPAISQQVTGTSYTVPADKLRAGNTYQWQVRQQLNGQWTSYSRRYVFKIKGTSRSNQAALEGVAEALMDGGDVDVAANKLATIDNPEIGKQAKVMLAQSFEEQKQWVRAIAVYNEVIQQDKESEPYVLLRIANCYLELDNKAMAKATLQRITSKYPDSVQSIEATNMLRDIDDDLSVLEPLK